MTHHVASHIDHEHPHDDTTTSVDRGAPRGMLLVAGVTAGSGAVLGGVTGAC